jgi:pimeloyl-ACP methyl ester carboxylesterase
VNLDLRTLPYAGGTIAALDYEPRRARDVALVVGHGYSSSKHNLDGLCGFLASHGFRVLSVDFPGHKLGASGGTLRTAGDLVDTMAAAVAFARERYTPTIYTVGHSMGASTALRAAAADPKIAGAISIATGYGRPTALNALRSVGTVDLRSSYVDGLTLEEMSGEVEALLDGALPNLAGRDVLYVAAERDAVVSLASARELFDRAPEPKTFATIASDHTSAGDVARSVILEWLTVRHARPAQSAR